MTRIGLDLRFWRRETAGLGRYSQNLLRELLKIDKETEYTAIITPADEAEFDLEAPNLKRVVIDAPHYSLSEQTKLLKLLNKEKFDLVHFSNFNHPILYRGKFVVTIHDLIQYFYGSEGIKKLPFWMVMNDCRRAEKIIAPSQSTKNDLIKHFKTKQDLVAVVPEGAEAMFKPKVDDKILEKYDLKAGYLLFVSRWAKYKGITEMIEAYGLVKDKIGSPLVILGRPDAKAPEVASLIKEKQALGWPIITPGFISNEDLAVIYAGAIVYIHPSRYEGFGIGPLEAMAAGVPVISSNRTSLPEVVGDAGLMFDPDKPAELAQAIEKIVGDPHLREKIIAKGTEQVSKFSWAKMAKQTLEIYQTSL